jgi:hypothetical protein
MEKKATSEFVEGTEGNVQGRLRLAEMVVDLLQTAAAQKALHTDMSHYVVTVHASAAD